MVKFRKRITAFLMSLLILCSSTFAVFVNAEHCYAGAFVPVLEYGSAEVLQWLFLTLGFSLSSTVEGQSLGEEAVDEVLDTFDIWVKSNEFDEIPSDIENTYTNMTQSLANALEQGKNGCLTIAQNLWSALKGFAGSLASGETSVSVSDGYDVARYVSDVVSWGKIGDYQCYINDNSVLETINDYAESYGSENFSLYYMMGSSYNTVIDTVAWVLVFGSDTTHFKPVYFTERSYSCFVEYDPIYVVPSCRVVLLQLVNDYGKVELVDDIIQPSMTDGNKYVSLMPHRDTFVPESYTRCRAFKWFNRCLNGLNSSTYENVVASGSAIGKSQDIISSGNYDVISKGQTAVGEGAVTITIPQDISVTIDGINTKLDDIDKALEKLQEGAITAGDVLDDAYVYPVDVVSGESVYEYEKEDGNSAVLPIEGIYDLVRVEEGEGGGGNNDEDKEENNTVPTPAILPEGVFDMLNNLKSKFPFCIPFDLVTFFKNFKSNSVEESAPVFTVSIPMPFVNYTWTVSIDMADYWEYVKIFRFGLLASFVIGLMYSTYKLISWQVPD